MISILLNTRTKDYDNRGNILQFLDNLTASITDYESIEVVFKVDTDDDISINLLADIINTKKYNFCIKYVVSDRVFYKGLHIGYKECFAITNSESKIIVCVADDFLFLDPSHSNLNKMEYDSWTLYVLDQVKQFTKDDIFLLTDKIGNIGSGNPIGPMWSRKLIELCNGFGQTYATDCWASHIAKNLKLAHPDRVIMIQKVFRRMSSHLDSSRAGEDGHNRAELIRRPMLYHHRADKYQEYIKKLVNNLTMYIDSRLS